MIHRRCHRIFHLLWRCPPVDVGKKFTSITNVHEMHVLDGDNECCKKFGSMTVYGLGTYILLGFCEWALLPSVWPFMVDTSGPKLSYIVDFWMCGRWAWDMFNTTSEIMWIYMIWSSKVSESKPKFSQRMVRPV